MTMNARTNIVPTRTFDYLTILREHYPKNDIFAACKSGEWTTYSVDEYVKASRETAYGLLAKGYKPVRLEMGGVLGGHSGDDINKGRMKTWL